jgi:hypothetical protein
LRSGFFAFFFVAMRASLRAEFSAREIYLQPKRGFIPDSAGQKVFFSSVLESINAVCLSSLP